MGSVCFNGNDLLSHDAILMWISEWPFLRHRTKLRPEAEKTKASELGRGTRPSNLGVSFRFFRLKNPAKERGPPSTCVVELVSEDIMEGDGYDDNLGDKIGGDRMFDPTEPPLCGYMLWSPVTEGGGEKETTDTFGSDPPYIGEQCCGSSSRLSDATVLMESAEALWCEVDEGGEILIGGGGELDE